MFDKICKALNPFTVNLASASTPPTIARSASPDFISFVPIIMALADEEHAVLIVLVYPFKLYFLTNLSKWAPPLYDPINLDPLFLLWASWKSMSVSHIPPTVLDEIKTVRRL